MLRPRQRDLLTQLVFRWPDPCYVVLTAGGSHAVVVTASYGSHPLERMPRGFRALSVWQLRDAGFLTMTWVGTLPTYGWRHRTDTGLGWRVAVTPAGRVAIGAASEQEQRRAIAVSAMRRCREATRGAPDGVVDACIDELRGRG